MSAQLMLDGMIITVSLGVAFAFAFMLWWLVRRGVPQLFITLPDSEQAAMLQAGSPLRRRVLVSMPFILFPSGFLLRLSHVSLSRHDSTIWISFVLAGVVVTGVFFAVVTILEARLAMNPPAEPSVSEAKAHWLVPERPRHPTA